MDWLFTIVIPAIAALILGYLARDNDILNFATVIIVFILSALFSFFMPLVICIWCASLWFILEDDPSQAVAVFIVIAIILAFLFLFVPVSSTETVQTRNISLIALKDSVLPSGTFFLGTGTIDNSFYYTYNYMEGDRLIPGIIKYDANVNIYPSRTDNKANIYYYRSITIRDLSKFPLNFIFHGHSGKTEGSTWIEIHLPPDSIVHGAKLDAQ
ncbi:MAG TPA: hypothetical protein PK476_02605 [Candidatus Pacearchaeota archaeon]|nr:hypothetical protein [Candidatus Pacearchaeota archaeon]HQM24772.1 hypothetical protein [Candidatus Pacearchaeota archaeon]